MPKITNEDWIKRFKTVHENKYNYSEVNNIKSNSKIKIICPTHGAFYQKANDHWHGQNCPKCGEITRINKRKMSWEEFLRRARAIHGWKYDYSKVKYINSRTKVCIICPEHGEFWQTPANHLLYECSKCAYKRRRNSLTQEQFITRANLIHKNKYDYSKTVYVNSSKKLSIICPIHGVFSQNANSHLRGIGCPKCGAEKAIKKRLSTKETFIEKATQIYKNLYDYSKVKYINSKTSVCIICSKHGDFYQTPNTHLNGHGYPKCAKRNSQVKLFTRLKTDLNLDLEFDKRLSWLKKQSLDIYSEQYNFAIEYNGIQHYKSVDFFGGEKYLKTIQFLDKQKRNLCLENNCKLWIIKYDYTEDDYHNLVNQIKRYIMENKKRAPAYCRTKGNSYERKIVQELNELGFNVGTTRNYSKNEDSNKVDIYDKSEEFPLKLQLKTTVATPSYFKIRSQSTVDPKDFCLIWNKQVKKNKNFCSEGECVIMDKELFYDLIKTKYGKEEPK